MNKLTLKVSEIKNNPNNPRLIKDDKFKKLVVSLKEFPIMAKKLRKVVIDEDNIILGGNMRFKALKQAGFKEVAVEYFTREDAEENNKLAKEINPDYVDKTYEEQCREFVIKDNVSGGERDWDLLANEWNAEELDEWGLDTPDDWGEEKEVEEDEAPEVDESEPPKSKLGEVYQLGRHRVMCGSATEAEDISKLLSGDKIGLIHTDPPYGVDYKSKKLGGIMNDTLQGDSLYQLVYDAFYIAKEHSEESTPTYCWYEDKYRHIFQTALEDAGYEFKQNLIWNKGMNLSGADYQKAHENVMYLQMKGSKAKWFGERDKKTILGRRRTDIASMKKQDMIAALVAMQSQSTVWDIDRDTVTTYVHPTQKPVTIAARAITNSSEPGDVVYDAFTGSGSTMIAAEQTGRVFRGTELDPKYTDVIRKRYWKYVNNNNEEGWEENTPAVEEK